MPPLIGAIADDLTGGMELAAMLVGRGVDCAFVTAPALIAEAAGSEAIVVALKTRVAPAAEATAAFAEAGAALRAVGVPRLFFKYCATFDSTDQGNIGPCADVLQRLSGAPLVTFCPSFPEVGRTVFQGHLFYGDRLISESPKRHDPLTPMTDPDLVRVLQRQTKVVVGLIPQPVVRAGAAALQAHAAALVAQGTGYAIADAATAEDLAALAALTADWPLSTGGSSIVEHMPALWRAKGLLAAEGAPRALPPVGGAGVVLAGSCADRTLEQLAAFAQHRPVLTIDLQTTGEPAAAVAAAIEWAWDRLAAGPVAIATSAPPDAVAAAQARLGRAVAATLAERILGDIGAGLRALGVRRFLVAGGETSGAVLARLGIDRLQVGPYRGPGIARATTLTDPPLALCLKSGKLGPVEMMLPMLEEMAAEG